MNMQTEEVLKALRRRVAQQSLAAQLGLSLVALEPGRAVVKMVTGKQHTNILGGIHGTAIFALIDEAFQASCNAHGTVAVALNMNLTFHRAPAVGEELAAESQELHRGRRTGTYQITVTDSRGRRIATCQALAYRQGEPLPFLDPAAALAPAESDQG
ncbi:MAG: PaaI family thioesterase [Desulfobacca sp.]|uniref:PaaI family thioesterase n=1 Tax=Desulfobacca sp. TaxID=2067990 RepID=UPI00404B6654